MEFRNARFNHAGTIDCEINHPKYGWIPYTCDPTDTGTTVDNEELFALASASATPYVPKPEPTPSLDEIISLVRWEIQRHIDATAGSRGYDSGMSLAGYASSTIPMWAAEAAAFIAWRDSVWLVVLGMLSEAQQSGVMPTREAVFAALPEIKWPQGE